ncbi:MAG: 50S ribosomal protein L29 [Bacteroidales bacterium]|nr:50S ribosomal protein L29 [Bacteroidales bacterium]
MKASELIELTVKELEEKIENEESFLTKQRLNHAVSPLDNPLKIRETRRNIARLKTVLSQKLKNEKA